MKTVHVTLDGTPRKGGGQRRKEIGDHTIRLYPGSLAFRAQGNSHKGIRVQTSRGLQTKAGPARRVQQLGSGAGLG